MKILFFGTALSALALAPVAVQAQPLPAPSIAVVNIAQVFETCTACAAALTQIRAQSQQLQQRAQQLGAQIETESRALNTLINALPPGAQPDAALSARIQAFESLRQNADREVTAGRERLQRNLNFVNEQIGARVRPAIQTIATQRGATIVMDRGGLIDANAALDITAPVLAIVNQNTAPLNINAPPPPQPGAAPAQPPAQQPQQNRPRPQGR